MGTQQPETRIQNESMLRIGLRRDVMAWRQQVGKYRKLEQPSMVVSIGTPGMSDTMLVVAVKITADMVGKTVGAAVGAEFKTPTGRQSEQQKKWQRAFEARGGIYRLVRSPEEMESLVAEVQRGELFRVED